MTQDRGVQNMNRFVTPSIMLFLFILTIFVGNACASDVKIGVLDIRGPEDTKKFWEQVSVSLNSTIPGYSFVIVPHTYTSLDQAVASRQLDFVVVNPAQYIELEVKYGASRIATQVNHVGTIESSSFGTVIFTKASRKDISSLADLKGKSLITASKTAFASWVVTRDELKRAGVAASDLSSVQFAGSSSDKVVMSVKNGEADAGSVRTFVLEQMEKEGKISLSDFKVLNAKLVEGFPFLLSSELYPEFAFARLKHTDQKLANKVAAQLLLIPHDKPVPGYPNLIGWTVPDNYEKVRKLLQEWRMPPYEQYGKVSLKEAIRQHWITVSLALVVFFAVPLIGYLSLNIKQRKKKYQILNEAKQKLDLIHAMIVETPDAVFIKDKRSRYVFVNPEAENLFGRPAGEIVGKNATDLFPAQIAQMMIDYDRMVITGSKKVTYEKVYDVTGSSRHMLVTKGPMYDDMGNIDGIFAVCRDITGFKQLQRENEERVLELETALSKVRQLEGIIPICSYCNKIRDDEESWQQMEKYIMSHSEAQFSHGICPECAVKVLKEIEEL